MVEVGHRSSRVGPDPALPRIEFDERSPGLPNRGLSPTLVGHGRDPSGPRRGSATWPSRWELLAGLGIKTIRDLGSNKYFAVAGVLVALSGKTG